MKGGEGHISMELVGEVLEKDQSKSIFIGKRTIQVKTIEKGEIRRKE